MSHPYQGIPTSNDFDFRLLSGDSKTAALEFAYDPTGNGNTFIGCFNDTLDGEDQPDWARRVERYDFDAFMFDTPGPHTFDEIEADLSIPDHDGDPELDGCHVYTTQAFQAWERDAEHPETDDIFGIVQNYGICVDSSNVEMKTGLLGVRAMDASIGEILKWLPAHYVYAERGYCSHGWSMSACASRNKQFGWCPATRISVDGRELDWDNENDHEDTVARTWCRSGLPDWLAQWTQANFMFADDAITYFPYSTRSGGSVDIQAGLAALKKLFSNKGQWHHGSNSTSGSSRPNVWKRIGGHAQTAFGGDWSEKTRRFYHDLGFAIDDDDFWIPNHQTWGSWSGQTASTYWPSWWGPQPEGAWVVSAKGLLRRVSGYAYLPLLAGVPGDTPPQPPTPAPNVPGELYGEINQHDEISIRGEVTIYDRQYIAWPKPGSAGVYILKPKPF